MIFNMVGGGGVDAGLPKFTYTGNYQLVDDGKSNGRQNWRLKLLTSGTLTFTRSPGTLDVFLVGAGGGGYYGGGGGGRTLTTTKEVSVNTGYAVVIGAGSKSANGGTTTALGLSAAGGGKANGKTGGAGGSGGGGFSGGNGGTNGGSGSKGSEGQGGAGQGTTTREFGESTGQIYAGGGGGSGGKAGDNTAGAGQGSYSATLSNGKANTGGGGGGVNYSAGGFSSGGSGIVILRNHR